MPDEHDARLNDEIWRDYLMTGEIEGVYPVKFKTLRSIFRAMPHDPRCSICYSPFAGIGGAVSRHILNRRPSTLNPQLCDACEQYARENQGGAEVELSMLFADIRGSTTIAEEMSAGEFSRLIDRFYQATTDVLIHANALVEKLMGDEVTGLFVPGLAGPDHARVALEAARAILRATGHGPGKEPWVPVGVGVHTGIAYVGAVGAAGGMITISALGDAVNTAARLASEAEAGEVVISDDAWNAARVELPGAGSRMLHLKGRSEPVSVRVVSAGT